MKVVATHFVMFITRPFGDEYREIKKVYELSHASGEYMVEHQGKTTHYEKMNIAKSTIKYICFKI